MINTYLGSAGSDRRTITTIYVLYLLSLILVVTNFIGVALAYRHIDKVSELWNSHVQYQIRTFWIGLVILFFNGGFAVTITGWYTLTFYAIWIAVRCCKGALHASEKRPIENPQTLIW